MLLTDQLQQTANMTDNEQRIAAYITSNLPAVAEMSIQELAAATYTSHSAIVRFAKKVGYSGFRELRIAVAEAVHTNVIELNDVDANFPFRPGDSAQAIAKNMADLTIAAVRRAQLQLDETMLHKAASSIASAQRLFLFAIGDSQIRARSLQTKLTKINKYAVIADEYGDMMWIAATMQPGDLAIFLSYGGNIPQHTQVLQFLHRRGIPALLITGNPASEQAQYASQTIAITQNEQERFKVGTFASQVSFEYILDSLFAIVYARSYQQNLVQMKSNYAEMAKSNLLGDRKL
ncbi:MurR/RpiR family transcriptional regulator [Lacticaseibacillus hulanensis]|jgi:DNA-binding MurR/RpiR family transcriptional regulator|uniref:MurR/RpiR family transcriptional regulator n=1 Tax=Lacticaseibacillus hulanensis TaxID=2493111 RepID=UPI000FD7882D|nr:MurR/RpiR family transcriptional regulator [Lacticaseibacillus hulanensis]